MSAYEEIAAYIHSFVNYAIHRESPVSALLITDKNYFINKRLYDLYSSAN